MKAKTCFWIPLFSLLAVSLINACQTTSTPSLATTPPQVTETITPSETTIQSPVVTNTPMEEVSATSTPQPVDTATTTHTEQPKPSSTTSPPTESAVLTPTLRIATGNDGPIIADHTVIDQFENIPDEYIQAASQLTMLFKHASVGANIDMGLNCMMGNFEGRRPNICDRGLQPGQIVIDPKYDRRNWTFELFQPVPEQNPGWYNKVNIFIDRVNNASPEEKYAVAGYKFGYVDAVSGSILPDLFFNNVEDDPYPSIEDLEALEAQHPDTTFIYWTLGLSRAIGTEEAARFNQQMREYAAANNKILIDIADIESHKPDGTPCTDVDGNGFEALCEEYTREERGGHLDSQGSQRMAKALWWLMARIAGWDGTSQ